MTVISIDPENPVVRLCIAGTQDAHASQPHAAHALYLKAWDARRSDYEACIAAHYVARHQATPADTLLWNYIAFAHADTSGSEDLQTLYPSLYLNLAKSYHVVGDQVEMRHYYELAARSASLLSDPRFSEMVENSELSKFLNDYGVSRSG